MSDDLEGNGTDSPEQPTITSTGRDSATPERSGVSPVKNWDRYRIGEHLGSGGMGQVFRGFDPRLERHVALKFIRGESPRLVKRFQQEARAQAQVEHVHVCKIHEVGEVGGHLYIAMQFVDGTTLAQAAEEMSLEQKLLAVQQIAEGLHAAHRTGLIHRDVKPTNIMVERTADGCIKPYVMDFGLARPEESLGMTRTGEMVGTPKYMSPEQALGLHEVDRRADVYGLGATLYRILAGRPPFVDSNLSALTRQVLDDVPASLRGLNPAIPVDVDSITLKCLRKSPGQRYGSARELAEDIGRYLDGEPVHARRTTMLYRLRMKAVKHRLVVAIAGAALAAIALTGGWAAYNNWKADRRAQLAQSFGRQVERIESVARYAHMAPLHDIRSERAAIGEQMDLVERRMKESGVIAVGPGNYALGRGHMTLENLPKARERLETAWEAGFRDPEVALALGTVLGGLYREARRQVDGIPDLEGRETRRDELRLEYLEPAATYLRQSAGASIESPSYVAALLASFEQKHDEALTLARQAFEEAPFMYEARQLEGDVYQAIAVRHGERGEYDEAMNAFESAESAYRQAIAVGRSDPATHAGLCALLNTRMRSALRGKREDVRPYFERGTGACESALVADADHVEALSLTSALHRSMAKYSRGSGEPGEQDLGRAVELAQRAIELSPGHVGARLNLGNALIELAHHETAAEESPVDILNQATMAFESAIEISPDFAAYNALGIVYRTLADHESKHGGNPLDTLDRAIEAYTSSIALSPDQVAPYNNIGNAYLGRASYEEISGTDPGPSLDLSIEAYDKALEINPTQMATLYNQGRAYRDRAHNLHARGEDPTESFRLSADRFRQAIEVNPESRFVAFFHNGRGDVLINLGLYEQDTGADPRPTYAMAFEAFEQALSVNPELGAAHFNLGLTHARLARYELELGEDPRASAGRAVESCRNYVEMNPDEVDAHSFEGEAYWTWARYELERGASPENSLSAGIAAFGKVLARNERDAFVHRGVARLHIVEGRWRTSRGESPDSAFAAAEESLATSRRIDPDNAYNYLINATLHLWRAEIRKGLEQIDRCLAINPRLAEGLALRGDLLLAQVESGPHQENKTRLSLAREVLQQALSINGNLTRRYGPSLARAKNLLDDLD